MTTVKELYDLDVVEAELASMTIHQIHNTVYGQYLQDCATMLRERARIDRIQFKSAGATRKR